MIFDALDGRVARLMRKTSDFGAQMDSLADVISFGVAPAFLLIGLVSKALLGDGQVSPISDQISGRIVWIIAAVYVCCGALRLARFNVENVHDESSHMWFKGLPIPGAASGGGLAGDPARGGFCAAIRAAPSATSCCGRCRRSPWLPGC